MSKYLSQLKAEKWPPCALPKPPKPPFDSFDGAKGGRIPEIRRDPPRPTKMLTSDQHLIAEADARADFCAIHRQMLEGTCGRYDLIEGHVRGDQAGALETCLLWRMVRAGEKVEQVAPAEIVSGITVGDVLQWVGKDVQAIRKERRLLLTCAASIMADHSTIH